MLARFRVLLPYYVSIPYQEYLQLKTFDTQYEEFEVKFYPPKMANVDSSITDVTSPVPLMDAIVELDEARIVTPISAIKINGREVIRANLIQVDLRVSREFLRPRNPKDQIDPPLELCFQLVNSLIGRLKSVGRMAHVKFIDQDSAAGWRLEYLSDTGEKLPKDENLARIYTGHKMVWKISGIGSELWDLALSLPVGFELPVWHKLILDATAQLPDINTSVILASAALECFIQPALDVLAERSSIPTESWKWLKSREAAWMRQPTAKEMFDQILYLLTGKSLRKDHPELWNAFDELRTVRNSIAHEGRAVLKKKKGKKDKIEVTSEMAKLMVDNASKIIAWVESLLPAEYKRVMFKGETNWSLSRPATGPESPGETAVVGVRGDLSRLKIGFGKSYS